MTEHVHGCLKCRPDMVPDFSVDDPRYHDGIVCQYSARVFIDGVDIGYTQGIFEGPDGWALFAGTTTQEIHECPTCTVRDSDGFLQALLVCIEPRFGAVEARHSDRDHEKASPVRCTRMGEIR